MNLKAEAGACAGCTHCQEHTIHHIVWKPWRRCVSPTQAHVISQYPACSAAEEAVQPEAADKRASISQHPAGRTAAPVACAREVCAVHDVKPQQAALQPVCGWLQPRTSTELVQTPEPLDAFQLMRVQHGRHLGAAKITPTRETAAGKGSAWPIRRLGRRASVSCHRAF